MDINTGMIAAGLAVGLLVGLTGMGAGSLMTPILISVFGIPAGTAVGSDLVYAAITKMFGAARHHQLKNVNRELGLWMAAGSVPAAILGVFTLYNVIGNLDDVLPKLIGFVLVTVGIAVAVRTFVSIPGLWDASKLPTDGELDRRHKILAVGIGVVFGFILGLTSVGSGVFFGMALVTLFPLAARRVVGTDLFHAMMVTVAAGLATLFWGTPDFAVVGSILIGSIPGILIGSHFTARSPDRLLRGIIAVVLATSGLKLLDSPPVAYALGIAVVAVFGGVYALRSSRRASEHRGLTLDSPALQAEPQRVSANS
jgi:uncharacterized membrane protein YfcA